ncbi:ATP-binding cassette domain-containing protein [Rhodococcus sp. NPDC058521]|uniref:ATP-binding cassette domain-containing protein n=1 Tax=Rhodococcus sp. NPDC058521 TaxID=3346536 RepID=UPI00364993A5
MTNPVYGVDFVAAGISVTGPLGGAFENVSLTIDAGDLGIVVGQSGSGRTSLLLALAGRMRLTTGRLAVAGHVLPKGAGRVRELVAVARANPATYLDPDLRVRELIDERKMIGGPLFTNASLRDELDNLGVLAAEHQFVHQLSPADALLFAVALSCAEQPSAIVVDDVAVGCTPDEVARVWRALATLTARGLTVVASTTAPPSDILVDAPITAIELPHPELRNPLTTGGTR